MAHRFEVTIYYEDTDFTGRVYHANYLKYFERAREHLLGVEELVRLYREDGVGFVVYRADLTFKEGAYHGDRVAIVTEVRAESPYRAIFHQRALRAADGALLVEGEVHLVCVDARDKLVKLPATVREGLATG